MYYSILNFRKSAFFLVFSLCILIEFSCNPEENKSGKSKLGGICRSLEFEIPRESITFILGEDKNQSNPYYAEAFDYYANNKRDRTEFLIRSCRSLLEVRDYLEKNPPQNGHPWGLINLVSHGNQWAGMSVPVVPDSRRSSGERINEFIENGIFKPLSDSLVDNNTLIFIHGCGLGNDIELLRNIARAFGGEENYPKVRASRLFEYYTSVRNNGRPLESSRFLARAKFVYFPADMVVTDEELVKMFRDKYPSDSTDWMGVFNRNSPRFPGDSYTYRFDIPVKGQCLFEPDSELPDLNSEQKKKEWLLNREDIIHAVNKTGIPFETFSWKCRKVQISDSSGIKKPAILIKGYSSMVCVLQALIDEKTRNSFSVKPFEPSFNDTLYYSEE